jgi:hypothetical protein
MNIEKVKNYNQKMLAIFSTLIVIIAAFGLISIIVFLIIEIVPNNNHATNALLSDKKTDQLRADSLRQQIISFNTPELVDTASLIYIIPINVKTLNRPEEMDKQVLGLLDIDKNIGSGSSTYYSESYYYGSFNNIIVYDFINKHTTMICNKKIIGTDLQYNYFNDEITFTFTGAENDTDQDDQITLKDLQDLFIYSLKEKKLKQIKQPYSTVVSYKYVPNKKDILITFGFDRNKNNTFDQETEPTFIMRYDYEKGDFFNIVDKDIEYELQDIIEK